MITVSKDYPGTKLVQLPCQITKKCYETPLWNNLAFICNACSLQLTATCRYCLTPSTQRDISKLFHVLPKPSEWMPSCWLLLSEKCKQSIISFKSSREKSETREPPSSNYIKMKLWFWWVFTYFSLALQSKRCCMRCHFPDISSMQLRMNFWT